MITPTTAAAFYDFNEKVIQLPLISLSAYVIALKCVVEKGIDPTGQDIEGKARVLLSCPDDYPVSEIYDHLSMVRDQTHEHYGIGG